MPWRKDATYRAGAMNSSKIVAANVTALIQHQRDSGGPLSTFQAIEAATARIGHKVGRSTIDRISKGATPAQIDNLEALAKVFDVELWQLLVPGLEPGNAPVLRSIGAPEDALYDRLRGLVKEIAGLPAELTPAEKAAGHPLRRAKDDPAKD